MSRPRQGNKPSLTASRGWPDLRLEDDIHRLEWEITEKRRDIDILWEKSADVDLELERKIEQLSTHGETPRLEWKIIAHKENDQ